MKYKDKVERIKRGIDLNGEVLRYQYSQGGLTQHAAEIIRKQLIHYRSAIDLLKNVLDQTENGLKIKQLTRNAIAEHIDYWAARESEDGPSKS